MRLSYNFRVQLTPELGEALEREAARLMISRSALARLLLAEGLGVSEDLTLPSHRRDGESKAKKVIPAG